MRCDASGSRHGKSVAKERDESMIQEQWTAVDRYFNDVLVRPDAALDTTLRASAAAGLPAINVSPVQGKFLQLLARLASAKRILEIGTLGGYSTIWLGRALPGDGKLITLEIDPRHAEIARTNIAAAGLNSVVEIVVGPALDSLARLIGEKSEPFDMIFIDADKKSTADYFAAALKLARCGSLIIVDNVVRKGAVADAQSRDANVLGIRRLNDLLAAEPRVSATAMQTVGSKGHDGFAMALVIADA